MMDRDRWLREYRQQTAPVIGEPFLCCLAEAVAAVESDWGRRAITDSRGLNEIGYKAVAGRPWVRRTTHEADSDGGLIRSGAAFRLFADRGEQARALAWLMRSSHYYETARLLYIMAFYSAYAPGRSEGLKQLLAVFNALARSEAHEGVSPLRLIEPDGLDPGVADHNHRAARQAVMLFGQWTGHRRREEAKE